MDCARFEIIVTKKFPSLTDKQLQQLKSCEQLYLEWNAKINVISRKDVDGFFAHHLLHSLGIALYAGERLSGKTLLDLGTGGGFPGIPLAIFYPESRFTLCDSIGKKTLVARSVAQSLGLKNVEVVCGRAEALPGHFDYVVSRAVAALPELIGWTKGKYREGLICLKGGDIVPETAAAAARYHLPVEKISCRSLQEWLTPSDLGAEYAWFDQKFVLEIPPVR